MAMAMATLAPIYLYNTYIHYYAHSLTIAAFVSFHLCGEMRSETVETSVFEKAQSNRPAEF